MRVVKTDAKNWGLLNGVFVFPETDTHFLQRVRKISRSEYIKCVKSRRKDDLNNHKKRAATEQWYEIDRCLALE